MTDFSIIVQSPTIRALVQQGTLERAFHDALFPRLMFRGESVARLFPGHVGDTMSFTGPGLITPDATPLVPGTDPGLATFSAEQWSCQLQQYGKAIDTDMPTSMVAIADLFLRNAQQLGLQAGQTLNRKSRDVVYNAGMSGWTVADGVQTSVTTVRVKRLNGFTTARRPDLPLGSPVQYSPVSSNNPLAVLVYNGSTSQPCNVIGFAPDAPGDQLGPGVLTVDATVTTTDRGAVLSLDRSFLVQAGGGLTIDALDSSDIITFANVRAAVARLRQNNVPTFADGRYHAHVDPTAEGQLFSDVEMQRLNVSLPDYYIYREFAVGEILGTVFYRDSECPLVETVNGGATNSFLPSDPFAGELTNASAVRVHRTSFLGMGGLYEYYADLGQLITDAGVTGRVGEPTITNNSIEVNSERIQFILRSPIDRLQQLVSTAWKFIGDWPFRTDVTTGDVARYKRVVLVNSGE